MSDGLREVKWSGKFEGELLVAEYLYGLCGISGQDAEVGDVSEGPGYWAARFDAPILSDSSSLLIEGAGDHGEDLLLTAEETEFLQSHGAILIEDSQGFVSVAWYGPNEQEVLATTWQTMLDEWTEGEEA